jgi:hypothetical protein
MRAKRKRKTEREHDVPLRLIEAALKLVREGELTGCEALELVLSPPPEVAERLGIAP